MIIGYLWDKLHDLELNHTWFRQDGATRDITREVLNLLKQKFDECVTSVSC